MITTTTRDCGFSVGVGLDVRVGGVRIRHAVPIIRDRPFEGNATTTELQAAKADLLDWLIGRLDELQRTRRPAA